MDISKLSDKELLELQKSQVVMHTTAMIAQINVKNTTSGIRNLTIRKSVVTRKL